MADGFIANMAPDCGRYRHEVLSRGARGCRAVPDRMAPKFGRLQSVDLARLDCPEFGRNDIRRRRRGRYSGCHNSDALRPYGAPEEMAGEGLCRGAAGGRRRAAVPRFILPMARETWRIEMVNFSGQPPSYYYGSSSARTILYLVAVGVGGCSSEQLL